MNLNPVELIAQKRDGRKLSGQDIQALITAYTSGDLPDYQMSAFLMAAYLNGLDIDETTALTHSMLHSGDVVDLSRIKGVKVDKHSTGGVGDKVSLLLAPIVAACGVPVPMISGRGLGHSGGTLDKLESIPGFKVDLSIPQYIAQLEKIGIVMIGQTKEIAPADRKIYALRDVTATVANISFIVPSILSKKIAAGVDALVLDVKCGAGAFMKSERQARALAERLVEVSEGFGKSTVAWLTGMDQPLGYAVGNWPEVEESIQCLQGKWIPDLMELTLTLAAEMLHLGGKAANLKDGFEKAKRAVESGEALHKFAEMVPAQGGDLAVVENPSGYPQPAHVLEVCAPSDASGFVASVDALALGRLAVALGAGRIKKESGVDPQAGLVLARKTGDPIEKNGLLATLYTNRDFEKDELVRRTRAAFSYSENTPPMQPLIKGRYSLNGWHEKLL